MTVDVDPPISLIPPFIVEKGVIMLLNFLAERSIKATFFTPSIVAKNFRYLLSEIIKQRHEVACHGLKHDPFEATINVNEQVHMIKIATRTIQSITGMKPVGFRAPLFKVNKNCWIALQRNGYLYDSSIVCSPLYGNYRIPFLGKPYYIRLSEGNKNCSLLEVPVSSNPLFPFPLGGAYMRIFGLRWIKAGIKFNFLNKNPVVFYVHPKDVIPRTYGRKWYYYKNTINCMNMLKDIIKYAEQNEAEFITAYELARLYEEELL
jgi:peptidoglycan/xylan/chitin deacetylase (PgdA/CDA1 family)